MTTYSCEGNSIYRNDKKKKWVATFKYQEDCAEVADSLNKKENMKYEKNKPAKEPVPC